jgi:hypothetical protein
MTRRLGRLVLNVVSGGAMAALVTAGTVGTSYATEPGDFTNYLRGATQGLPLGALPPPGLYAGFGLNATGLDGDNGRGDQHIATTSTAPAFGYGFNLLYVPGWTFLGASYGFAVVQGFYQAELNSPVNPPFVSQSISPELANTNFTPIDLSWNLGGGWFAALALTIVGPDGSRWPSSAALGAVDLNPDYWTVAPGFAVSYLDANWELSANFRYDINTASQGVTLSPFLPAGAAAGYVSGNLLFADFTALYKLGKWSFGPVGYFVAQTTPDSPGGGVACTSTICGYQSQADLGWLIGYDFGPVAVQVWADESVECANCIGNGFDVWGRMSFKIWGPEAKPIVTKD